MSSAQIEQERLDVSAEHIGGIDHTDVTFQPGIRMHEILTINGSDVGATGN